MRPRRVLHRVAAACLRHAAMSVQTETAMNKSIDEDHPAQSTAHVLSTFSILMLSSAMTTIIDPFPMVQIAFLLTLSLLLSTTFRFASTATATSRIDRRTHRGLTTVHAFALEGAQVAIVLAALWDWSCIGFPHGGAARLLASLALHAAAIYAVDVIETLVVLGRVRHPVQVQTFVLCRKRLWPALINLLRKEQSRVGLPAPKAGGVVVVARKGFGLWSVRKMVVVEGSKARRYSDGELRDGWETRPWMPGSIGARARRHSFPDDQLNTRPLLFDARLLGVSHGVSPVDAPACTEQPRGRTSSTSTSPGKDDCATSTGRVRRIVGTIEGTGSPSRGRKKGRESVGDKAGVERGRGHAAPRWRPAGGTAR